MTISSTTTSSATTSSAATSSAATSSDAEPDWSARHERRQRILDAAADLARLGGFEAVQMRVVAEQADVAIGTLYRYFSSKIDLLVTLLVREMERNSVLFAGELAGETAFDRVMRMTELGIISRQAEPRLHSALMRAYVFAGPTSEPDNSRVGTLSRSILCSVMQSGGHPHPDQVDIASVLADVWHSNTVGWVAGRLSHDDFRTRMERAARLLLRD